MITLRLENYDVSDQPLCELTADVAAAVASLAVDDNTNVASSNSYIIIGEMGQPKTDIRQVTSITGKTTITLKSDSKTQFAYDEGEKVRKIPYNQIKIYRSNTQGGTYSLLATVDMTVNKEFTLYDDSTGDETKWYKMIYYNSTTATGTSLDDATAFPGGMGDNYIELDDVRKEAGFDENFDVKDSILDNYREEAKSTIDSFVGTRYALPLSSTPKIIRLINKILAGGLILLKEYTEEADGTNKEGKQKFNQAMGLLEKIAKGEIKLFDEDGVELPLSPSEDVEGMADFDTETQEGGHLFNLSDENFRVTNPEEPFEEGRSTATEDEDDDD